MTAVMIPQVADSRAPAVDEPGAAGEVYGKGPLIGLNRIPIRIKIQFLNNCRHRYLLLVKTIPIFNLSHLSVDESQNSGVTTSPARVALTANPAWFGASQPDDRR